MQAYVKWAIALALATFVVQPSQVAAGPAFELSAFGLRDTDVEPFGLTGLSGSGHIAFSASSGGLAEVEEFAFTADFGCFDGSAWCYHQTWGIADLADVTFSLDSNGELSSFSLLSKRLPIFPEAPDALASILDMFVHQGILNVGIACVVNSFGNCVDDGDGIVGNIPRYGGSGTAVPVAGDRDGDGITDDQDDCPDLANPDQADADSDGIGDVCEPDSDSDGVIDDVDNCVSTPNPDQQDTDGDGQGNACDADDDGDGVDDDADNCPLVPNPNQADLDNDSQGDACDADVDGDGINDAEDQCLGTAPGETVVLDPERDDLGCSIAQLCPCENEWKNHGAYVSCVAHTSEDFVDLGLITEAEKDAIVSAAGSSQCGHKE